MNTTVIYLLKVALAISLLTLPYLFILRKDPNLRIKRIYLLGSLILSWLFPLITLSKPEIANTLEPIFFIDPGSTAEVSALGAESVQNTPQVAFNWSLLIPILYIGGILSLLAGNLSRYRKFRSERTGETSPHEDVVITNTGQVLTFFHKIFLPEKYKDDADVDSILIHERAHIRQLHIIDVLFAELSLLLTWFNPFSWLISKMIKENHEHLADRSVLRQGVRPAHYKALLLNHAMGGQVIRLGHQFNHSLTKNRFDMMKKIKAPRTGILKYIFMIPVITIFTLMATASTQEEGERIIRGTVYLESKDDVATGASVVIIDPKKRVTSGCVADREGNFALKVEGNPDIVISFVGYKTLRLKAKEIGKKDLIMQTEIHKVKYPGKLENMDADQVTVRLKTDDGKEPVYILDGKRVKSLDVINKDDIESLNVIKDDNHELAKKYNAKNGVLIITSKAAAKAKQEKAAKAKKEKASKAKESDEDEETVFFIVEDMPKFPGGKTALAKYINENLSYPKENGSYVMGTVDVLFKVKHDGSLADLNVVESSKSILNNPALELVKEMPNWTPGKQRGKPVSVKVQLTVRFDNPPK